MALDTREKRASAIGVGRPWMRTKEPAASKDEQWRMASGNTYGGNALTPAAGGLIPYPNPRYALTGGMQPMGGGIS